MRTASRWSNTVFSLHPFFYPLVHQMRLVWKIPLVTSWQYPSTSQFLEHFGLGVSDWRCSTCTCCHKPLSGLHRQWGCCSDSLMQVPLLHHLTDRQMSPLLTTHRTDFLSTSSTKLSTPGAGGSSSSRLTSPQAPAQYKGGLDRHMLT